MNATQVLMLYLKEEKKAYLFPKIIRYIDTAKKEHQIYRNQKGMNYDTIRNFLTINHSCLFDFVRYFRLMMCAYDYVEWCNISFIFSNWYSFIRRNINKNYFKILIPHCTPERDKLSGWINGYHDVDYTLNPKLWEK